MELKYTNLNSEIVWASQLDLVELSFLKILRTKFKNESNTLFSQVDANNCPQNKKLYNFDITNQNGMNKSFSCM